MKELYLILGFVFLTITTVTSQLVEAEGNVKLDNTLELFDGSSGTSQKVGTLFALFPLGAGAGNSPTLTLRTETSPIPSNVSQISYSKVVTAYFLILMPQQG